MFHSAIHYRDFRVLWLGMMASFMAFQMQQLAIPYLAFRLTGSPAAVAAITLAWGAPQLSLTLVGGAISDRLPKREVLRITQAILGVSALVMALILAFGQLEVWHLVAIGLVQGFTYAFNGPARTSFLPTVVPRERLSNAVALNNSGINVSRSVGPAIAGFLISVEFLGPAAVFFLMAGLYIVVQLTLRLVNNPGAPEPTAQPRGSILGEMKDGVAFIARSPLLRTLVLLSFAPTFAAMPSTTLLSPYALDHLLTDSRGLGFLFTAGAIGSITGSLLVAYFSTVGRRGLFLVATGVVVGVGLLVMGTTSLYPVALLGMFLVGASLDGYFAQNSSILMASTPRDMFGRLMGIVIIGFSAAPFAALPAGLVAERIGTAGAFAVNGVLVIVVMVLVFLFSRSLRRLDQPEGATAG